MPVVSSGTVPSGRGRSFGDQPKTESEVFIYFELSVPVTVVSRERSCSSQSTACVDVVVGRGRCKHRNTGASTGIDRNTGESRRNAPEYTVCVNVYDVCVCSVWLYFVFNVSRTN